MLHGNESLKRKEMRRKRQKQIFDICMAILLIAVALISYIHTFIWAAELHIPATETETVSEPVKEPIILDKSPKPEPTYIVDEVTGETIKAPYVDSEDPYEAMDQLRIEQEEIEAQRRAEEEAKETAAAAYRASILDKYGWVQHDESGVANDMTDELVIYTYELCNEYNIDPGLVFGMIMVESRGFTGDYNTSSGAAGLGQFLASTAKLVYEDFLGNGRGSYDHSVTPYNPYTGVTMMVTYLNYLYSRHGNTMTVLESYSGNSTYAGTLRYYNKVVSWCGRDIG